MHPRIDGMCSQEHLVTSQVSSAPGNGQCTAANHNAQAHQGCPVCTPERLCHADQQGLVFALDANNNNACVFQPSKAVDFGPAPGWWYMPHGGANDGDM